MFDICEVLLEAREEGATDVYLKAGVVPGIRKNGKLSSLPFHAVSADDMLECLLKITNAEQRNALEAEGECCFSYEFLANCRYRVNAFKSRGMVSMVFHVVPTIAEITKGLNGQQEVLWELAQKEKGLILFTGNAGDGRTSSMAAVLHTINRNFPVHIMTLESPVEVMQVSATAMVNQRESGEDFTDPVFAVEGALKEAVDVLVYDGVLDGNLITKLCRVAGTGMLVLASTYGKTLSEVIGNITAFFPQEEKDEIRKKLSEVLQAVVICELTEEAGEPCQKWEMISVDARVKNQIRNCL